MLDISWIKTQWNFLENDKSFLVHVFNLVYVYGNIVENKLFLTFNLILMLKTKNCIGSQKNVTVEPIQTALVWFGSVFILKLNWTKPNCMFFYLAVRMTFSLKAEPNCTTNTYTLYTALDLKRQSTIIDRRMTCNNYWR